LLTAAYRLLIFFSEGLQPMTSADGRYVIAFNGEIYNHAKLRAELKNTAWRGHSDTGVMLGVILAWGLDADLAKFAGMFAIAVWGKTEPRLYLIHESLQT
jgi:asparagine synthase (glutamine-hydrolysing)